jgi:tRNA threonylcarbamoyl adenosine modification protein YeaZ
MNILAVDNSSTRLSVAVAAGTSVWSSSAVPVDSSVAFTSMIDFCLSQAGLSPDAIEGYVLGTGPGSFTGLRMSLSLIKGFHAAVPRPIVALPSYYALAGLYTPVAKRCVFIFDARRGLVYGAVYRSAVRNSSKEEIRGMMDAGRVVSVIKPGLFELETFLECLDNEDYLFAGESRRFADSIRRRFPQASIINDTVHPQAGDLIPEALRRFQKGRTIEPHDIIPLYLHPDTCQVRGVK